MKVFQNQTHSRNLSFFFLFSFFKSRCQKKQEVNKRLNKNVQVHFNCESNFEVNLYMVYHICGFLTESQ